MKTVAFWQIHISASRFNAKKIKILSKKTHHFFDLQMSMRRRSKTPVPRRARGKKAPRSYRSLDSPLGGEVRQVIFCCSPTKFGPNSELPQARVEAETVEQRCRESCPSDIIEGTTAAALRRELGKRTAVATARFLFCGHADVKVAGASGISRNTLGFTNPEGGIDLVQPDTLVDILGAHAPSKGGKLQLVFLNGCSSYQLGEAVHKAGIPFVVCWHTMVHDEAARIFSEAFYVHLERPTATYAEAFEQAKHAVHEITISKQGDNRFSIPKFSLENPAAGKKTASGAWAAGIPHLFGANAASSAERSKSRSKSPDPKSHGQKLQPNEESSCSHTRKRNTHSVPAPEPAAVGEYSLLGDVDARLKHMCGGLRWFGSKIAVNAADTANAFDEIVRQRWRETCGGLRWLGSMLWGLFSQPAIGGACALTMWAFLSYFQLAGTSIAVSLFWVVYSESVEAKMVRDMTYRHPSSEIRAAGYLGGVLLLLLSHAMVGVLPVITVIFELVLDQYLCFLYGLLDQYCYGLVTKSVLYDVGCSCMAVLQLLPHDESSDEQPFVSCLARGVAVLHDMDGHCGRYSEREMRMKDRLLGYHVYPLPKPTLPKPWVKLGFYPETWDRT
jgi:hypothetical protein